MADEIAQALVGLLENYSDVENKVRAIKDLEHKGDDVATRVTAGLQTTFVTPIDREDIVMIAARLDDFIDAVEEAARKMWLYKIEAPTKQAKAMAHIIAKQAKLMVSAMPLIEDNKHSSELIRQSAAIRLLEDEADKIVDSARAHLFDGATDVPSMVRCIRWGELYEHLEDATDRAQDVARSLEDIALKNA